VDDVIYVVLPYFHCRCSHISFSLSGKYFDPNLSSNSRFNLFPGYMERYKNSLAQDAVMQYVNIAKKYNYTPTELALLWCKSRPYITSTIIGATTVTQLRENLGVFKAGKELPQEALEEIDAVYKKYRDPI